MHATILAAMLTLAVGSQTDTTFNVSPGTALHLENYAGSIEVATWTRNAVRVEARHSRRAELQIDREEDQVQIEIESRFGAPTSADFKLTVPASMELNLSGVYCDIQVTGTRGSVELETVQGDIEVVGGEGHISAQSVQGHVRVDGASGHIEAASVNEVVEVANARGELTVESVNGLVKVSRARVTSLEASTVNGSIVFEGDYLKGGRYEMSTHGGGIYVAIPTAADLSIEASTYAGSLSASFSIDRETQERRRKRTLIKLGNGSAEMSLETFQGDIRLIRPGEKLPDLGSEGHDHESDKFKSKTKWKPGSNIDESNRDED